MNLKSSMKKNTQQIPPITGGFKKIKKLFKKIF